MIDNVDDLRFVKCLSPVVQLASLCMIMIVTILICQTECSLTDNTCALASSSVTDMIVFEVRGSRTFSYIYLRARCLPFSLAALFGYLCCCLVRFGLKRDRQGLDCFSPRCSISRFARVCFDNFDSFGSADRQICADEPFGLWSLISDLCETLRTSERQKADSDRDSLSVGTCQRHRERASRTG